MAGPYHRFSLDQLTVLVAVVETGSFSAAGRRLGRVQSAVSHAVAQLEDAVGVPLFDRGGRRAALTDAGKRLLSEAQLVLDQARAFEEQAASLRRGLEPSVHLVVDALFPRAALVDLCRRFQARYEAVSLRVEVDALGDAVRKMRRGDADVGVCHLFSATVDDLTARPSHRLQLWPVCAPGHPLADRPAPQPRRSFGAAVQVVLSERDGEDPTDRGVLSQHTWRVSDLDTKEALLLGGVGWGSLPEERARPALSDGRLVRLRPEPWPEEGHRIQLHVVRRQGRPLGPAGQWLFDALSANHSDEDG